MAESKESKAYYVSRPLADVKVASHNFIVTGARYPGDPKATVHSFGANGTTGKLDRVGLTTTGFSKDTHGTDRKAWLALKDSTTNDVTRLDAKSSVVERNVKNFSADKEYWMLPKVMGKNAGNSNTAAHAIAVKSVGRDVPKPGGSRPAPGADQWKRADFRNQTRTEATKWKKLTGAKEVKKPGTNRRKQPVRRLTAKPHATAGQKKAQTAKRPVKRK